jgi:peptidoglycan/xylan/chitin deacetylase (PgdA/CDA1 family)
VEGRGGARDVGPDLFRKLSVLGVPTFLLIEGVEKGEPRKDPEGERLGAWAEAFYRGLSAEELLRWPGGVARALSALAGRHFYSAPGPPEKTVSVGEIQKAFAEGRYVRAVNFHTTPPRLAADYEEQLARLAERFVPVTPDNLKHLATTGEWPHERPGVLLNFFDGHRHSYEVAAPILDRLGLIGWFYLVSAWISTPPEDQRLFADEHLIHLPHDGRDVPTDGRLALSPDEARDLARRGHVIASHTHEHTTASPKFAPDLSRKALARELAGSKRILENLAGGPVGALAWREGTPLGAEGRADRALAEAGYELLLANHAVQRVPRASGGL